MGQPQEIKLTYADYRALPEDGRRYEILEGILQVSPSAKARHQRVVLRLLELLMPWVRKFRLGVLMSAPMDVILADDTIVQPDILFIAAAREKTIIKDWVHGAPDLVIEVASPGTQARDRGIKRQIYARFGVREYWLVDPEALTVTVLVLSGRRYVEHGSGAGDTAIESPILRGFKLIPAEVFSEI